jgi:hypothetical protein
MLDSTSRWDGVDGVSETRSHAATTICQWGGPHSTLGTWLAALHDSGLTIERMVESISGPSRSVTGNETAMDDQYWANVLVYAYRHEA